MRWTLALLALSLVEGLALSPVEGLALLQEDDWVAFRKLAVDKDPDARVQAVERIRRLQDPRRVQGLLPLLADEHPRVRLRALQALRALRTPAEIEHLTRVGLRHSHPLVRQGTCEALAAIDARSTLPALLERIADPESGVRAEAVRAAAESGDAAVADRLIDAFRRHRDWPTRTAALESVARLRPAGAAEVVAQAQEDTHYAVRMVAAEVWPRVDAAGASAGLARLLDDRDWRVRVVAIAALLELRDRAGVGRLIERLGEETGRLRWDLLTALMDMTGKDLGLEPKAWQAWWQANRETFQPRPRTPKGAAPVTADTQASFFKVPILSNRIIFVLDLSGSMRDPSPEGASLSKLDVARKGMIETIRSLDADTRFGILGLGSDADGRYTQREQKTWGRRLALLPATPELKADAERFIRRLEARGWTNLYDALEYAFSDPDVDTIYVYSDGGASKGVFFAGGEILSQVARMNRFRRIVIHTVEVPGEKNPEDNRRLLARLAEDSGGTSKLSGKK